MERNDESPLPPSQIMVTPEEQREQDELRKQVLYKMRLQQLGNHHIAEEKLRARKEKWKQHKKQQRQKQQQQQQQQREGGVGAETTTTTTTIPSNEQDHDDHNMRGGDHQIGKLLDFVSCGSLVATCHEYADVGSIVDPRG